MDTSIIIGFIGIALMLALIIVGMPIGIALFLSGFVGIVWLSGWEPGLFALISKAYSVPANFILAAIPLFIFMGHIAYQAGAAQDFYTAIYKWVGKLPGGVAIATVMGCGGFAAASGSSLATASVMGGVALPEMKRFGYKGGFGAGAIAAGGTIGSMIPPSILMVVYGMMTETSVGALFMAGFIPGILEVIFYSITILILCNRDPSLGPRGPSAPWGERFKTLVKILPLSIVIIVVLGGIYGGIFTPTEAAGVGAFASLAILIVRKRSAKGITSSLVETMRSTGMIFIIIIGAMVFSLFITASGIAETIINVVVSLNLPPLAFLAIILLLYLPLGCLMDALPMILITLPILLPLYEIYNFNLIWIGILMIRVMEIALITPPVGLNVFVISGMAPDVPLSDIFRGIIPFFVADIILLAVLLLFPSISLFLPSTMR